MNQDITISSIEVQLLIGDPEQFEMIPYLSADSTMFFPDKYFSNASGVINNPFNHDLHDFRVSAILFDDAGNIVGGGFSLLNFVKTNDSTGIIVPILNLEEVANVELYPNFNDLSYLDAIEEIPARANELILHKQGYGQTNGKIGYGVLVENPNDGFSVEKAHYRATAYAPDGTVIGTDEGFTGRIQPGQTLGIAGEIFTQSEIQAENVKVEVIASDYVESDPIPTLRSENVDFLADENSLSVTGQIANPYISDIGGIKVFAIVYDDAGNIIGGGYTLLDFIPAKSREGVDISVTAGATPESIELYVVILPPPEIE